MEQKIFVTGGSGFIGKHFLKHTGNTGNQYTFLSRDPSIIAQYSKDNHKYIKAGIEDIAAYREALSNTNILIYLAGEKNDSRKMQSVNCTYFEKFLECLSGNQNVKIIYLSSAGVYGLRNQPGDVINEGDHCIPENAYEKSKLEAENNLLNFIKQKSIESCYILRPTSVIGEYDSMRKLYTVMKMIRDKRFFYINPNSKVNYVYAGYVADVINEISFRATIPPGIYNLNSPMTYPAYT